MTLELDEELAFLQCGSFSGDCVRLMFNGKGDCPLATHQRMAKIFSPSGRPETHAVGRCGS